MPEEEEKPRRLKDVIPFDELKKSMKPEELEALKKKVDFLDAMFGPMVDSKICSKEKRDMLLFEIDKCIMTTFNDEFRKDLDKHLNHVIKSLGKDKKDEKYRAYLTEKIEEAYVALKKKAHDEIADDLNRWNRIDRSLVREVFENGDLELLLYLEGNYGYNGTGYDKGWVRFQLETTVEFDRKRKESKRRKAKRNKGKRNICKDDNEFYRTLAKYLNENTHNSLFFAETEKFDEDCFGESDIANSIGKIHSMFVWDDDVHFNVVASGENAFANGSKLGEIIGFTQLPTGECVFGYCICGDWEDPVNFIIYVEDGKVKIYAPEKGNHFNPKTYEAYGNEDMDDEEEVEADRENYKYDAKAEIEDIADYFHNRGEFEHADGKNFLGKNY